MKARSSRLVFLGILAVFLLPLILAWLMYTGRLEFGISETDNQGRLVTPPQPLDWSAATEPGDAQTRHSPLEGAWVVLFPLPDPCNGACLERVRALRQVHRALGRQGDRVRIAVLSANLPGEPLQSRLHEIHRQVHLLYRPEDRFTAALQRAAQGAGQPSVYLVDPLGNIMMTYEAGDPVSKMHKDLKKLLTWSKLDEQP